MIMLNKTETIGDILQDVRDEMDMIEDDGEEVMLNRSEVENILDRIEQAYVQMAQKFAIELENAIDEVKQHYEKC